MTIAKARVKLDIILDEPVALWLRDLMQNPLYEDTDLVYLDTHYYGGVKKYQWVALPLAIHGVIVKKDGTVVNVNVGEDEDDPVVYITDLLIHLAGKQLQKKAAEVIFLPCSPIIITAFMKFFISGREAAVSC